MIDVNDPLVFDRLADGELSPSERQQLLTALDELASLDDRITLWRRLALGLLEAQVLRREFKALLSQEAPFTAVQMAEAPAARSARLLGRPPLKSVAALAASALVAFGIGWTVRPAPGPAPVHPPGEQLAAAAPVVEPSRPHVRDAVTLVVNDEQGQQQRVRLPLVDANELGDQWAHLSPDVPVELKSGLRDHGFDLRSKQRFAPLFFEQGQRLVPMVVPVSDTYVVPVERPVY